MRSLLVVCLLTSIASADPGLPSDAAFKGKPGDWTHFEVERSVVDGVFQTNAVAILPSTMSGRIAWFAGDALLEQPWQIEHLHGLLRDLAKDKGTKRQAATCKLASNVACTKLVYVGEVTSLGSTSKVAVTAALAAQIAGSGIYELEVKIDDKLAWRMKAVGYGNGTKPTWGSVPWKTTAAVPPELVAIMGAGGPPPIGQSFIDLRPENGPIVALAATGSLDKAIIRRYLKRNLMKLVYCYEKEQLAKPKLQGSVDFSFEIGGDGKVTASRARGLDKEVEQCASSVVKNIEFPKPRDQKPVTATFTVVYQLPRPPLGKKI